MSENRAFAQLRRDYEFIALTRVKRVGAGADVAGALDRLVTAGLVSREGDAMTLLDPASAGVSTSHPEFDVLQALHTYWLRADDEASDDEILYGELGYWQHWWNALREHQEGPGGPLRMDMIVAEHSGFIERDWLSEFDPAILAYVAGGSLISGRVIVPSSTLGSPAESLVENALGLGLEIRVFPARVQFAIYDESSAVLRDEAGDDQLQRHRRTRRAAVVEPLRELFAFQWAAAIPWLEHAKGAAGILQLLAQGWTDARIARALGVSTRTVSRRVSRMMDAAGVHSRFALGMRYALSEAGDTTP